MNNFTREIAPVCRADVDLSALKHNLSLLSERFGQGLAVCMLKANAYGHGATKIAQFLERTGIQWFGVATIDEGIELRNAGVRAQILVMSGCGSHFYPSLLRQFNLTPLVSNAEEIREITKGAHEKISVHIDIDTGMSRGGFLPWELTQAIFDNKNIHVEGISTHFAQVNSGDCEFSLGQLDVFRSCLNSIFSLGVVPKYIHVDKSASILGQTSLSFREQMKNQFPKVQFLMRCGLSLYGIDPNREGKNALKPVLRWRAPIVLRKRIPAGTPVGYDGTFVAKRDTELAIVRLGYADGLKRQLSNRGTLFISGKKVPIVGRISMDLTTLDVTDLIETGESLDCDVGRFADIIGPDAENGQGAWDLADTCDTIPYEILTSISARVQRFYDEER